MELDISIIVPAYNEENFVGKAVRSIFDSCFRGTFEVIVVCNGCTDQTARIARAAGARVLDIPTKGAAEAANYGAKQANGKVLAFLDADTMVSNNLLAETLAAWKRGCRGGRTVVRWRGKSVAARLFSLVSYIHVHKWGGFCFVDRHVFREVGGYKAGGKYGFDFDLAQRVSRGRKVALLHRACVFTSDRRFVREGWWRHMGFAIKRYLIDAKILGKGVKSDKEIYYEDHR